MKRKLHKFTEEQAEFLIKHVKGRGNKELTDLFNKHFGLNLKVSQVEAFKKNRRLSSGLPGNRFAKGYTPYNKGKVISKVPIGAERIDSKGYVMVKVAQGKNQKNWQYKHILLWEKHNGPVPLGHVLLFADGNKRNVCLENLMLVTKKQMVRLNQLGLIKNDAELTRTGIVIADLANKIGELRRTKVNKQ